MWQEYGKERSPYRQSPDPKGDQGDSTLLIVIL